MGGMSERKAREYASTVMYPRTMPADVPRHPALSGVGRVVMDDSACYRARYPDGPGRSNLGDMVAYFERDGIRRGDTFGCSRHDVQRAVAAGLRNPEGAFVYGINAIINLHSMFAFAKDSNTSGGAPAFGSDWHTGMDVNWPHLLRRVDKPLGGGKGDAPVSVTAPDAPSFPRLGTHLMRLVTWEAQRDKYLPPFIAYRLDVNEQGITKGKQLSLHGKNEEGTLHVWSVDVDFADYVSVGDVFTIEGWDAVRSKKILMVHSAICRIVPGRALIATRGLSVFAPDPKFYDARAYTPLGLSLRADRCVVVLRCMLRHEKFEQPPPLHAVLPTPAGQHVCMPSNLAGFPNVSLFTQSPQMDCGGEAELSMRDVRLRPIHSYKEALRHAAADLAGGAVENAVRQGWVEPGSRSASGVHARNFMSGVCAESKGQPDIEGHPDVCAEFKPAVRPPPARTPAAPRPPSAAQAAPRPPSAAPAAKQSSNVGLYVGVSVGVVALLVACAVAVAVFMRRRRRKTQA